MTLEKAVTLIKNDPINSGTKNIWAGLGCGAGLFTYALASYRMSHDLTNRRRCGHTTHGHLSEHQANR